MEVMREIMSRLGVALQTTETKPERDAQWYKAEYGLSEVPSEYEVVRIEYEQRRALECRRCLGLSDCQYESGSEGFEPVIKVEEIGGHRRLYFEVKKCRYRIAVERRMRYERECIESGVSMEYEGCALSEELQRGVESKRSVYLMGEYEASREGLSLMSIELMRRGEEVRYWSVSEVVSELRVSNERYHEALRGYERVKVLSLEWLSSKQSGYNEEQLGMILNYRRRMGLRTLISSGVEVSEQPEGIRRHLRDYLELRLR